MKVLFIAGSGRSGSTILESVLGEIDGWIATGELCFLWERGCEKNTPCSCNSRFRECSFWPEVMTRVEKEAGLPPERAARSFYRFCSLRGSPRLIWHRRRGLEPGSLGRYRDLLAALYRAIAEVSGARVIIDSSKYAGYGLLLDSIPSLDVHTLHLVRDSRGVSHSYQKTKPYIDTDGQVELMRRHTLLGSVVRWHLYNATVEWYAKYQSREPLRLTYERFVSRPYEAVSAIVRFVERRETPKGLFDGDAVVLHEKHLVSGNPARFARGWHRIRGDHSWRRDMPVTRRLAVTALTLPQLVRYGYRMERS